jgi:carbamoyl-phosphate synthase large subunit
MDNTNILFTSVGRRNYMIPFFRECFTGKIYASNSIKQTSGMFEADEAFVSPPIKSEAYIPFLLDLCQKKQIKLIVPLFDMDLSVLAKDIELFNQIGTKVIVSETETIEKCFDKLAYSSFTNLPGFKTPKTYTSLAIAIESIQNRELQFPLIIKPRWGTGSIATHIVDNLENLKSSFQFLEAQLGESYLQDPVPSNQKNQMLIQEMVKGQEFGVDIVNDFKGNFYTTVVKKKLAMRAGETDMAEVMEHTDLQNVAAEIANHFKHIGILDADFIIDENNTVYLIDLNPRFGGGYPFSHAAGLNVPLLYKQWLSEEFVSANQFKIEYGAVIAKGISLHKQK